jgi:hypothetical protein
MSTVIACVTSTVEGTEMNEVVSTSPTDSATLSPSRVMPEKTRRTSITSVAALLFMAISQNVRTKAMIKRVLVRVS